MFCVTAVYGYLGLFTYWLVSNLSLRSIKQDVLLNMVNWNFTNVVNMLFLKGVGGNITI